MLDVVAVLRHQRSRAGSCSRRPRAASASTTQAAGIGCAVGAPGAFLYNGAAATGNQAPTDTPGCPNSAPIQHPNGLTTGDFTEADEPLRLFATWFEEAKRAEPADASAMTLATVDADGLPNARMVLLKGFDERGFVFYTNHDSQKGQELDHDAEGARCCFIGSRSIGRCGCADRSNWSRTRSPTPTSRPARGSRRSAPGRASSRRRSKAAWRSRRRSRSRWPSSRLERFHVRRTGRATASYRSSSNSGRIGRTGCTTASSSAAQRAGRAVEQDAALSLS